MAAPQSRRRRSGFTALRVEGSILPAEFLSRVAGLGARHQGGADYGLSASLGLKEEIARYWRIGSDLHRRYAERRGRRGLDGMRVGVEEWLVPFLHTLLGYDDLAETGAVTLDDRVFALSHHAFAGAVPALLTTREFDLDKAHPRFGQEGRRQAPHGSMQEYLNGQDAALWGLVGNGARLRLLRDNPSLTRPAYIEADLDLIFDEELYPGLRGAVARSPRQPVAAHRPQAGRLHHRGLAGPGTQDGSARAHRSSPRRHRGATCARQRLSAASAE